MDNELWFGSEGSYAAALAALDKIADYQAKHPRADSSSDTEPASQYLTVIDGVGIINIEGSLYDGTFGELGRWFGLTGYGDIAQAAVEALKNPDVASIMLNIKSGGGSVAGCQECGNFLMEVDKLKPVVTYTSSTMASAALWLGVSARKVYASETSIVGSIGTLSVVASRERQLKDSGIDAVVVRSGENKALGHPVDPLTDKAIEARKEQVDYFADLFIGYVAERRGMNRQVAKSKFGDGREFVGAQALDAGLVDAIMTYAGAFTSTKSFAPQRDNKMRVFGAEVANRGEGGDNPAQAKGQTMPTPHLPTPEQLAALVAGAPAASPLTTAADATTSAASGEGSTEPAVTVETLTARAAELTAEVAATNERLTAATAQVAELQARLATATEALAQRETQMSALADIVKTNMKGMTVALNGKAEDVDNIVPSALAEAYTAMAESFKQKFKAGGVAATARETDEPQAQTVTVNPLFVAAAQLKSRK